MKLLRDFINRLSNALVIVAMWILALVMLFTVTDVVTRYFVSQPLTGGLEITQIFIALACSFSFAYCQYRKRHITVGQLTSKMSPLSQNIVRLFSDLAGAFFCMLIAWKNVAEGIVLMQTGVTATLYELPLFPVRLLVAFGWFVFGILLLLDLLERPVSVIKDIQTGQGDQANASEPVTDDGN